MCVRLILLKLRLELTVKMNGHSANVFLYGDIVPNNYDHAPDLKRRDEESSTEMSFFVS